MATKKEATPVFPADDLANHVDALAKQYEPLVALSKQLRAIGSLDNTIAEREAKTAALQVSITKLNEQLDEETAKYNDAVEAAENFVRQRNREADDALAAARVSAEKIVAEAQAAADRLTVDAQSRLYRLREDVELAARQRAEAIEANTRLDIEHKAVVIAREEELAGIEQRINDARAQVAKMLGGA